MYSYSAAERAVLAELAARGGALACPCCDSLLSVHVVDPGPSVPYVRHRLLLICPGCRRAASVDVPGSDQDGAA
jgi:hypothetical protein